METAARKIHLRFDLKTIAPQDTSVPAIVEIISEHCPFKPDAAYVELVPNEPGHIHDWAAKAASYIAGEGRHLSVSRLASIVSFFCKPLEELLREAKREHRHCDDSWYCCGKCTHPDHGSCGDVEEGDVEYPLDSHDGEAARVSGVCNCGADAWNKRVDEVLNG